MTKPFVLPGDCREVMSELIAHGTQFDSCVTDPPYHLTSIVKRFGGDRAAPAQHGTDGAYARASRGFMGKQWDGGGIAFDPELWALVFDLLKPGGYLLAFSGTRTYHRMACAIEDAGFEIRDQIGWMYGAGMPKSHNLDRYRGRDFCDCEGGGTPLPYIHDKTEPKAQCGMRSLRGSDVPQAVDFETECWKVLQPEVSQSITPSEVQQLSTEIRSKQSGVERGGDIPAPEGKLRVGEICPMPAGNGDDGAAGRLCDGTPAGDGSVDWARADSNGSGSPSRSQPAKQRPRKSRTVAVQPNAQAGGAWPTCARCSKPIIPRGLGTALKPAWEPICVARKPLIGTVAENVLAHGTGALNIDSCRVHSDDAEEGRTRHGGGIIGNGTSYELPDSNGTMPVGRWPANVIHDGSDEVDAAFPDLSSAGHARSGSDMPREINHKNFSSYRIGKSTGDMYRFGDSGSAARFFYKAKADSSDRLQSKHPTVKPVDLMAYLCRLVTQPSGTVLDPFAGSGTTGMAAMREGFNATLIERDPEYVKDILYRLDHVDGGDTPLFEMRVDNA